MKYYLTLLLLMFINVCHASSEEIEDLDRQIHGLIVKRDLLEREIEKLQKKTHEEDPAEVDFMFGIPSYDEGDINDEDFSFMTEDDITEKHFIKGYTALQVQGETYILKSPLEDLFVNVGNRQINCHPSLKPLIEKYKADLPSDSPLAYKRVLELMINYNKYGYDEFRLDYLRALIDSCNRSIKMARDRKIYLLDMQGKCISNFRMGNFSFIEDERLESFLKDAYFKLIEPGHVLLNEKKEVEVTLPVLKTVNLILGEIKGSERSMYLQELYDEMAQILSLGWDEYVGRKLKAIPLEIRGGQLP